MKHTFNRLSCGFVLLTTAAYSAAFEPSLEEYFDANPDMRTFVQSLSGDERAHTLAIFRESLKPAQQPGRPELEEADAPEYSAELKDYISAHGLEETLADMDAQTRASTIATIIESFPASSETQVNADAQTVEDPEMAEILRQIAEHEASEQAALLLAQQDEAFPQSTVLKQKRKSDLELVLQLTNEELNLTKLLREANISGDDESIVSLVCQIEELSGRISALENTKAIPPKSYYRPFMQMHGGHSCRLYSTLFSALQVPVLRKKLVRDFEDNGTQLIYTFPNGRVEINKSEVTNDGKLHVSNNLYVNGYGRALTKYLVEGGSASDSDDDFQITQISHDGSLTVDVLFGFSVNPISADCAFSNETGTILYQGEVIDMKNKIISVERDRGHATSIYYDQSKKRFMYFDNEKGVADFLTSSEYTILRDYKRGMYVIG